MNVFVRDYNVFPHGQQVQTDRIQAAIDACAASGGGQVIFDTGVYRTGTLWLRSNTYLYLPPMCRIWGSDNFCDYNAPDAYPQNTPIPAEHANGMHLIVGVEIENCGIFGGGIIDGNGAHFGWRKEEAFQRPSQMIHFVESTNIRLRDLELVNSPYWNCHLHGCENVLIHGLKIKNHQHIYNGDGIDIDASRNVVISDCLIDTQDDCITFRCNTDLFGSLKKKDRVLEYVTVTNCQLRTKRCNAFRIGVGNGPIRNCRVSNTVVYDSAKAICMDARYAFNDNEKCGTPIDNISFDNCYFDCEFPIWIGSNYKEINTDPAPRIRNINFSNITMRLEQNIAVQSNPNAIIENITFHNVDIDCVGTPELKDYYSRGEGYYETTPAAFYTTHVKGLLLRDVRIHVEQTSPIRMGVISYGSDVKMENVSVEKNGKSQRLIEERDF